MGPRRAGQGRGAPVADVMNLRADTLPADLRLLLAHKQKTSARLRFLRLPHGLAAFTPLPESSVLLEETGPAPVAHHPAAWLRAAEARLGLAAGSLKAEVDFSATVCAPEGPVSVQLASFETIDPPFAEAASLGGRFVAITEARDATPVERELLRRAYTVLLG